MNVKIITFFYALSICFLINSMEQSTGNDELALNLRPKTLSAYLLKVIVPIVYGDGKMNTVKRIKEQLKDLYQDDDISQYQYRLNILASIMVHQHMLIHELKMMKAARNETRRVGEQVFGLKDCADSLLFKHYSQASVLTSADLLDKESENKLSKSITKTLKASVFQNIILLYAGIMQCIYRCLNMDKTDIADLEVNFRLIEKYLNKNNMIQVMKFFVPRWNTTLGLCLDITNFFVFHKIIRSQEMFEVYSAVDKTIENYDFNYTLYDQKYRLIIDALNQTVSSVNNHDHRKYFFLPNIERWLPDFLDIGQRSPPAIENLLQIAQYTLTKPIEQPKAKKKRNRPRRKQKQVTENAEEPEHSSEPPLPSFLQLEENAAVNEMPLVRSASYDVRVKQRFDLQRIKKENQGEHLSLYHTLNPIIDGLIEKYGICHEKTKGLKKGERRYFVPGVIEHQDGQVQNVLFNNSYGADGKCYHRGYEEPHKKRFIKIVAQILASI